MVGAAGVGRPVRVLIVDDHRIFADVLALRLRAEAQIADVEVAFTLSAAKALLNTVHPDVVYLDYILGEGSGLALLAEIDRMPDQPGVLVLSAVTDVRSIIMALAAGVHGWVSKDSTVEALLLATEQVLQGHLYLPPSALRPVIRRLLADAAGEVHEPSFVDDLTKRELEVLRCLVAGMNRAEVAERLFLSVNTVRTHVQNILHRSGQHSTLSLVAEARRRGVHGADIGDGHSAPTVGPSSS